MASAPRSHCWAFLRHRDVMHAESAAVGYALARMNTGKRVHLGPGPNIIPGWDNLDIEEGDGIILHDLRTGLPYPDNSVQQIFSEHVIEHFTKAEGQSLLEECYRALAPGGQMRVGWPDLTKLLRAYIFRGRKYKAFVNPHLHPLFDTWDERLSDCLFSWDHRYAYTKRHLMMLLGHIGFIDIRECGVNQSGFGIQFDTRDDPATTFLETVKPR
jgi:predicted SAM-dependent methyltransferase